MDNQPSISRWTATLDELRTRRAARLSRRALERDLATYTTPAQLSELNAILSRYEGPEVTQIRQILNRKRAA